MDDLKKREAEFYRRLQEEGLLIPRSEPAKVVSMRPLGFKPVKINGKPASQTLIEDRD